MIKYGERKMIEAKNLDNLELLKTHCMFSDEFEELPKERQTEIYRYCKLHATHEYCQLNLEQIRYAVTKLYFAIGY